MKNTRLIEAMFYEQSEGKNVRCVLCPHECVIPEGKVGLCRGRMNKGGKLFSTTFAETIALHVDPVEKKPLYHFYPGNSVLSIGPNACNFRCENCQNWEISQERVPTSHLSPERAIEIAGGEHDCIGISFTYTEPLVWFEYVLQTSKLARERGLKTTLVTNGFINPAPAAMLLPFIDGLNLDIKSMDDDFYRDICGARLEPVLDFAAQAGKATHIEVTNLVIPGLNDSDDQVSRLVNWVHQNLGPDTPLHFSRYFPRYKMTRPETPIPTLLKAAEIAKSKLNYVYLGNVRDNVHSTTYCPNCGNELILRSGYSVRIKGLSGKSCASCGLQIPIVL
ncbi:AmmeMemoRadiSam system radical SAM enzyme [bacterium]|nr:AmmeMemoRadiSam system radical SAM enzyme [bacterium]